MTKARKRIALLLVLMLVGTVALAAAYLLGRDNGLAESKTFYATIDDIRSGGLCVIGLQENDINHRTAFRFSAENVPMIWRGTEISLKDLQLGDRLAVTYNGSVQESSPAGISNVIKLELLSDRERGWSLAAQCVMHDMTFSYNGESIMELPSGAVEFGSVPEDYEGNCEGTLYGTPGDVVYFQYEHVSEYAAKMPYFVLYPDSPSE